MHSVEDQVKRTQRYWYVDGLSEIATGIFVLLLALFFVYQHNLPQGPARAALAAIGQPVLILLGFWLGRQVVQSAKQLITYPRTGYVAYRRPTPRRWVSSVLLAVIVAAGVGLLVSLASEKIPGDWMPFVAALFMSLFMIYVGAQIGLVRFYFLGAYLAGVGVVASLLHLPDPLNMAALMGGLSVGLLVSGGLTLRHYLSNTKPASAEEMD